jgi:hypothetical protein
MNPLDRTRKQFARRRWGPAMNDLSRHLNAARKEMTLLLEHLRKKQARKKP